MFPVTKRLNCHMRTVAVEGMETAVAFERSLFVQCSQVSNTRPSPTVVVFSFPAVVLGPDLAFVIFLSAFQDSGTVCTHRVWLVACIHQEACSDSRSGLNVFELKEREREDYLAGRNCKAGRTALVVMFVLQRHQDLVTCTLGMFVRAMLTVLPLFQTVV
eukprot:TRINITY_DN788_c0_g2_i1.p1 TRINITY_DN788_c0_g2~~TRINITY_DN788_c0_g2_i1.p1  ORF type:complete len:160 (+),score=14.74 TRINITY_DN788_c0_g2_i1:190-669(+)